MNSRDRVRMIAKATKPMRDMIRLNAAASVRTRVRGTRGWIGATNTDYDPLDPATAAQPFDAYRALHRGGRVHYNPKRSTFILHRHEDVRAALRDTDAVTSTEGVTRIKMTGDLAVLQDGPEHARSRKQVQPAFSKRAMESWRGITDKLAAELVGDVIANPGCDVVEKLAIPLPIRMIAQILGIPEADRADFRRWSEAAVKVMDLTLTRSGVAGMLASARNMATLRRYFRKQLATGTLKGSGTVLGRLVEHSEEGELTDSQLCMIAIHLLIAGNETTTNLLGGMFDTLAHNPEQYELIRANPDLVPMAVEEQLRITTPIQNLYRYTRADYQVGDVTIPSGSRVLLSFGAANRDPEVFPDPDTYRADRDPKLHIAFGYGPHMCLGAPLARLEATAVLREMVTHVARIKAVGDTTWSTASSLRGPTHLRVALEPDDL